jgi:hypothetical protein
MDLLDSVMGLPPVIKVALFGDYNLNTGQTHPQPLISNLQHLPQRATNYRASGFVLL